MAEPHIYRSGEDHPFGGRGSLASSLVWAADRLAESLLEEQSRRDEADEEDELVWGVDAAAYPPVYWHWLREVETYRNAHPDLAETSRLPTEGPLLSIVVPVYRPELWYFEECVRSVQAQSYQDWELCLCDDASGDPLLTQAMAEFAAADPRIKALALAENGGISRATNMALEAARGQFIVLLDHDDVLVPDALAEIAAAAARTADVDIIYSDEDKLDQTNNLNQPHFKPDWDPDLLLSFPYFGHITVIRRSVLEGIGGFRPEFDGSQDFDVMLRASEVARRIEHIPKVLYHWRVVAGSAAGDSQAKPWAYLASRRALEDAVARRGIDGWVETGPFLGGYHVRRRIHGAPTVSAIIPFRDQAALTLACLDSLSRSPGYELAEVVLIDNDSSEPETRALRRELECRPATRVIDYPGVFNWSAINNAAAATCDSDLLLFLNNDIEAASEDWLKALVEQAQRPEIGAVGARLNYPDGSVQHAGVILDSPGIAAHIFNRMPPDRTGYFGWDRVVRSYTAVTGACMMVRRRVFEELGGFDELLPVAFNDVDFCLRLGRAGYRTLYTPHATLIHHESVTRGRSGFSRDTAEFLSRWWDELREDDPYYNPNLGRFEAWCTFRMPYDDEKWLDTMGRLLASADRPMKAKSG